MLPKPAWLLLQNDLWFWTKVMPPHNPEEWSTVALCLFLRWGAL